MTFRKILCPTDFSPGSQRALDAAAQLARTHDSELIVMHAWSLPAVAFAGEYMYAPELVQQTAVDAQTALDAAVADLRAHGVPRASAFLVSGPAALAIEQVSKEVPAIDLIVLGTHGRTGAKRVLLGSVAEAVVRHATCAVLAIRPHGPLAFQHVLCPVDFSAESAAALELAAALVQPGGKGLSLVHVAELPAAWGEVRPFDVDHEPVRLAAAQLEAWAERIAKRCAATVTRHVSIGRAGAELLAMLDHDPSIDLVVMGNRGRAGLARLVLGSVAEKVVRYAHCPVLVTHAARDAVAPLAYQGSAA